MAETAQLMGSQTPRIDVTPLYFTSAGDDAVDLAAVAGLHLDPWQQHVLRGALGERVDGRWKAFEVGLIVPRQNGKGSILEARELAGMFLFGERLILHSAHLFGTAVEHQQRLESLIRGSELIEYMAGYAGDPQGKMSGIKTGNSGMSLTTANGNRVLFKARSRGSARGFTADLVVFDEAYDLPRSVQASMLPTLASKSLNESPQIWYASSAGMPDSEVLKSIRDRALSPAEETKLAFYEWSTVEDADPADPANWALANPALGRRISAEYVDSERRAMSDEHFKRERLGIWSKVGSSSAIPADFWVQCLDAGSVPSETVAFGVDVTPLRDVATIAAASMRPDGTVHIEVIDRRAGTEWVPGRLEELRRKWEPVATVYTAAGQTSEVVAKQPRLRRHLTALDHRTYSQACGAFYEALGRGGVRHTGQDELDTAVQACRRSKGSSELWYWTRDDRSQDISPLVAVTLAHHGLLEKQNRKAGAGWALM